MGGYDSRLPIMEDADLCIRLHMAGGCLGLHMAATGWLAGWLAGSLVNSAVPPALTLCLHPAPLLPAGPAARPGRRGQVVQLLHPPNHTSGRRLSHWGAVHGTRERRGHHRGVGADCRLRRVLAAPAGCAVCWLHLPQPAAA